MVFTVETKKKLEVGFTYAGIILFIIHCLIIQCIDFGFISADTLPENLFGSPFASLFTPFSILLIYEVYLLIYYLRESYSKSVSKQIEIMALILLRNSFKDINKLMQGHTQLFQSELIKDVTGFIALLVLLWAFYHLDKNRKGIKYSLSPNFILLKERISVALFWIFLALSFYSIGHWVVDLANFQSTGIQQDPSHIFYSEFFTLLTFVDVVLLLSSAKNLSNTILVIRNSGYVLSTLLMRISFSLVGWERISAVVIGAGLAVFMMWISEKDAFRHKQAQG